MMNRKQRLLAVLDRKPSDGPPVICPGGMMSMVCREIGETNRDAWPEAHMKPETMADMARILQEATGFENYGVPFCVTVEAEALGGLVNYGDFRVEPRITDYIIGSTEDLKKLQTHHTKSNGRIPAVLEAISILKSRNTDIPVIGNLTGPASLATSLMDPDRLFRLLMRDPSFSHELIDIVTETIAVFGIAQAEAGADVISIGDPAASGEIIGAELFREYVLPSLQRIIGDIRSKGARTILHICGNTSSILDLMKTAGADAISFDAVMPVSTVRQVTGNGMVLMGNISTFLLAEGPLDSIMRSTQKTIDDGIDIVSPACGLGTETPKDNIRRMVDTVQEYRRKSNEPEDNNER
ncbi:MAG: MtaA/CmuA family methyltransferase [Dehalococcoidales bacterium]|nr:MtaA/CmuA family methyltransferase [Dehalococcoidales bacterium]